MMFGFLKKFKRVKIQDTSLKIINKKDEKDEEDVEDELRETTLITATSFVSTDSARVATDEAAKTFAKPVTYNPNTRKLYDSGTAKHNVKAEAFSSGGACDPYTDNLLELRVVDAKRKYGEDWQSHLAEADHVIPIAKVYSDNKNNPWLTNDDIKNIANSDDNLEVVGRDFNNAKRSRTNEELVSDDDYLKKTGVELSRKGKQKAIQRGNESERALEKQIRLTSLKNALKTTHDEGVNTAKSAGITSVTISSLMNITAVIKGEKSVEDALADTAKDTGKAAVTGYVMGGGLTALSHSLTSSSSGFIQALSKSNVPGRVITAVMCTGQTLMRFSKGEISTQECLIELGEKGLGFATAGYSMAAGQILIPIPIVGAAVGALVGSMMTCKFYNGLVNSLKVKEIEHQERLRIIAECEAARDAERAFRAELEQYLDAYFAEYRSCFDEALSDIQMSFQTGDADGVIAGANKITRKLGGRVRYETLAEFETFLLDGTTDVL
jgi:hypothetical protein